MKIIKKLSLMICSFILVLTGLFFVGCGKKDYSNISLTASVSGETKSSFNLDKGKDIAITFTINNFFDGMNGELEINPVFNTTDCFTYQANYNGNGVTTVVLSGTAGGRGHLYAVTKEGGKSCDIEIVVDEYSDEISNNDQTLYITENTSLSPESSHFNFNSQSTIRDLDFYFFGVTSPEGTDLTLDDIKNRDTQEFMRKFVKVSLISRGGNDYLLFEDENGNLFTAQDTIEDRFNNVALPFIPVTKVGEGEYEFNGTGKQVKLGDKFTFFTVYNDNLGNQFFTTRDFYVLKDLNGDQITYSYTFDSNNYDAIPYENSDIILVPNKQVTVGNTRVNYQRLTLELTLPTDTDLVDMNYDIPESNGLKILNIVRNPSKVETGKTVYSLTLSNLSTTSVDSVLNIDFFYKGFSDVADTNVNYRKSIPVSIVYEPKSISVNGDSDERTSYVFYNNYASTNVGWQAFNIEYAPNDARLQNFEITFDKNQVNMMYRGVVYDSGSVTIDNLTAPIYFKGVQGASVTDRAYINVRLNYSILTQDHIDYRIPYSIITGAENISFDDSDFATQGVYVALGSTATFNAGLYADAYFSNFTFEHTSESDVVDLVCNGEADLRNGKYYLSFNVYGKAVGMGRYNIVLDNGKSINIIFRVIECLDNVTALVQNENANISFYENKENSTLIYIKNEDASSASGFNEKASVTLVANGNRNSTAITSYNPSKTGTGFNFTDQKDSKINVSIVTTSVGSGKLVYTVTGSTVENFKLQPKSIQYSIDVVSYSLIEGLNVLKTHDGRGDYNEEDNISAGNVTVYYGTDNTSKKTATFALQPRKSGYLFFDPLAGNQDANNSENYVAQGFTNRFVTWTANSTIRKDGVVQTVMVYDPTATSNRYTIDGRGTFDTESLTFEAFNYASANLELTATIRQFDRPYSFTVSIRPIAYNDVTMLSLQDYAQNRSITFTASERTKDIVLFTSPRNATDPSIGYVYEGVGMFDNANGETVGITYQEIDRGNGTFLIRLSISQAFIDSDLAKEDRTLAGRITFASADWIVGNNVLSQYLSYSVPIDVYFANGTESAPYNLDTPQDVLAIKDMPSAHYKISTTIDMSGMSLSPLGVFSGSIVGTTEQAQIIGINVTRGDYADGENGIFYGLFSAISENAVINGVKFKGSLNVEVPTNDGTYSIGILAGLNYGKLINVGVELSRDSRVSIQALTGGATDTRTIYIGGVVGRNALSGKILQDYTEYTTLGSNVYGQSPNILMYSGENKLVVSSTGAVNTNTNLYVGGVSGVNAGSIQKIDNSLLNLFGYSDYLSYINIEVSGNNNNHIGGVAGLSNGLLKGYVGKTVDSDKNENYTEYLAVATTDETRNNVYSAGRGIVVGGSIVDASLTGINNVNTVNYVQYVGGVVGELAGTGTYDANFSAITSRTSVLGSKNVGALTGFSNLSHGILPALAMQAVDSGATGFNASMVAIINRDENSTFVNEYKALMNNRTALLNKLAFGGFAGTSVTYMNDRQETTDTVINVFSYVNRTKLPEFDSNADKSYYYGNFVLAKGLDRVDNTSPLIVYDTSNNYVSCEFEKASQDMSISANTEKGFTAFNLVGSDGTISKNNKVFYMYYFGSAGFVYQEDNELDYAESQALLNEKYNTLNTDNALYPLVLSRGVILRSLSTDILSVDQSGKIVVMQTGLAKVQLSSILDASNNLSFYIYVVDYFNIDKTKSVVYPTPSSATVPIDETILEINGDSTLDIYIRPSTATELKLDNKDNLLIENDIVIGENVKLRGNETLTAGLKMFRQGADRELCVFTTRGNIDVDHAEVDVNITGQTITFNHNEYTKEYFVDRKEDSIITNGESYRVEISPMLSIDVQEGDLTQTYICEVNKKLNDIELRYLKGAERVDIKEYNEVTFITSKEIKDEIIITTTREDEPKPYYVIENSNHEAIFSSWDKISDLIDPELRDEIFKIDLGEGVNGNRSLISYNSNTGRYVYSYPLTITFNPNSRAYRERYDKDMYGDYYLVIYSGTDETKHKAIKINLERTFVENIVIDNYSDINLASDLSSTSRIGIPGRNGLLAITLIPQDCDFDYILIENDAMNSQEGNGFANFSLVARTTDEVSFKETIITGTNIGRGVRFTLEDILKAYETGDYQTEDSQVRPYDGVVYIRYNVGTAGVGATGKSKFNVTVVDGSDSEPEEIQLDLQLEYKANVDLVGKDPIPDPTQSVHAIYQVARGLRYELSLDDIWGFSKDNVELSLSSEQNASLIEENGTYYLQITDNEITYSGPYASFDIIARARQKDGEIERDVTSKTTIRITEYVVNYNFDRLGNADIVSEMENGIINVRIGNIQTLEIDLMEYIEFDERNNSVFAKVQEFLTQLTTSGTWRLYTNLDALGQSTGHVVTINDPSRVLGGNFSNIYLQASGLDIQPRATHNPQTPYYMFTYNGNFGLSNTGGVYEFSNDTTISKIQTQFVFNVFQSSSEESPIPIDNYEDFIGMQNGGNYILLSDIVIPNANSGIVFTPLTAQISSLDGNDYKIYFAGRYDFGNSDIMSLFREVSSDTMLKNITIELTDDVTFVTSSSSAFSASLLAASNQGVITNCNIIGGGNALYGDKYYFSATSPNLDTQSYITGLVVNNAGSITNSRSSVNIKTTYNASGFVGTNSGKIASSYYKGGRIEVGGSGHIMAGLVVNNNEGGNIITSYVSGNVESNYVYSRDTENSLNSTFEQAGFVHTNQGYISDCYTNIRIFGSSTMAGFVHNNGGNGNIVNCFSTSVLEDRATSSAGFAVNDTIEDNEATGSFKNCFYFKNDSSDWNNGGYANILLNASLLPVEYTGVKALNRAGFAYDPNDESDDFAENFGSYATYDTNSVNTNSVWFYARTGASYNAYNYTKTNGGAVERVTQTFNTGRLELVSANVIATSRRVWAEDRTVTDATGEVHYEYDYDIRYPRLGSLNNPYVIRNASNFENMMQEEKTASGYNYQNYRIVDDINYSDLEEPSKLYEISFSGQLEGNGMDVRNIILASAENLAQAGMFAQIGRNLSNIGVVMNLNIYPLSDIAFTNTAIVGGLAGVLNNGYIFNVNMYRDNNAINVAGKNFVGGLIGRAEGSYRIFNSTTDLSAVANYVSISDDGTGSYETSTSGDSEFSYAGGLVGYAAGQGQINTITLGNINTVMGGRIGLAFGGIGRDVTVSKLQVTPLATTVLRAYKYGGFVAGESRGKLDLISVNSSVEMLSDVFAFIPRIPDAVGGVIGVMQGGTLSRVQMNQGFATSGVISASAETQRIKIVGGVVGLITDLSAKLDQVVVNSNIYANQTLGGIVGTVSSSLEMSQVAVKSEVLRVTGYSTDSSLGGLIAKSTTSRLTIKDSYSLADLELTCHSYATQIISSVGGLIAEAQRITSMERCYTTANIKVELLDRRSSDDLEEVYTSDLLRNFSIDHKAGAMDNTTISNTGTIKDVYFFGRETKTTEIGEGDNKVSVETLEERQGISYRSNANLVQHTMKVLNIGRGSFEYNSKLGGTVVDKTILNNLFDYYTYTYNNTTEELFYVPSLDRFYVVGDLSIVYQKSATESNVYEYRVQEGTGENAVTKVERKFDRTKDIKAGGIEENCHENTANIWVISTEGGFSTLAFETQFEKWFN